MGRKSEYAHSKTLHEHLQTAEGETEQAVSLMTVQDITELSETDIIGIHRNLKPFRAKRMDWRTFPPLATRTKNSPPPLPALAPVPDIPPLQQGNEHEVFDIDNVRGSKKIRYIEKKRRCDTLFSNMNDANKIIEKLEIMQADISGLKSDVSGLKSDISGLKDGLAHTNTAIKTLATKKDVEALPTKNEVAEIVDTAVDIAKNELKAEIITLNAKVVREVQSVKRRTTNLEEHQGIENPEKH